MFKVHLFFYKQPVYNQLSLGWEIAKQLSELNPLLISNNKNYRLKKSSEFFPCNKRKIAVKLTEHQNSAVSKEKLLKSLTVNIDFES